MTTTSGGAQLPALLSAPGDDRLVPTTAAGSEDAYAENLPSPQLSSAVSFANLTRAFRHRWVLALSVGLAMLCAFAAAAIYLLPAKYTAYALLRVEDAEPQLLPDAKGTPPAQTERYFENTQVALIKSRPILVAALRQPGVGDLGMVRQQADAAAWLEETLKVHFLEKTDILRVSLDGTNPAELAKLVNAVKDAYLEEAVNARRNKKKALLDDLETVYDGAEKKIRAQRAELRQLAETLKSSDSQALSVKQKAVLDEYASLRKELALLQAQLRTAEIGLSLRKAGAKKGEGPVVPEYLVEQAVEADPFIVQKKVELTLLDGKLSQAARLTEARHPIRARYMKERKVIADELERLRSGQRALITKQVREKMRTEVKEKSQQTMQNVVVWRRQEALLKTEVDHVGKEAEKIGIHSFELELKRGEIEQAESVIKRLREEKERLQVELQSTKQRVTVLHPAEIPTRKNMAAHFRLVGLAGFAGLLCGVLGVCTWQARRRRIMSKDEVVNDLGCRIIGVLPWVKSPTRPRQAGLPGKYVNPALLLNESVDSIRALLLCDAEGQRAGRILMITSAVAREGKTTLASHLALSVAQAGKKTLLIDCDFRRPELHRVFDIPRGPGLGDVLRGQVSLAEAIRPGPLEGLSILPAGEESHQVSQAQVMTEMRKLLEGFRSQYDFIVVDCCPVLPVADALFIGKRVDGVLLSVRPRLSQVPQVHTAFERLAAMRIPVLGAVINGERARLSSYEYGYLPESKD